MAKELHIEQREPRILIVGLITPQNMHVSSESYFEEFKSLVHTNGITEYKEYFTKLRSISPKTFLTKGKLEEIQKVCLENDIEEVIFSEIMGAHQEHMLSKILKANVFDRTQLILEIFEKAAVSGEGKLQVEIAFLEFKKTRLAGRGKEMSQQRGFIGGKGPGETQKEIDIQHIDHLLVRLKKELKHLEQVRDTQRKQRLKSPFLKVSLIGYTNAGKSTILNTLTNSDVLAEDKLFATLDTTTRELFIEKKKIALISDTVGFIQNLPHTLIESFKSTLNELQYADLLLHIIDISNKDWKNQLEVVMKLLEELDINQKKMVYVFNKIDKVNPMALAAIDFSRYGDYVLISANSKEEIHALQDIIFKKAVEHNPKILTKEEYEYEIDN